MTIEEAQGAAAQPIVAPASGTVAGLRERASFLVMVGGNIFNMITLTALAPVLALIGDHFADRPDAMAIAGVFGKGASGPLIAQLMITLLGIGIMVGGPIAGWLAERVGPRRLLCGALALYAITGASGLWLDGAASLLGARLAQGFVSAGIATSIFMMIGQRYEGAARARILGLQGVVLAVSGLVSLISAGGLAEIGGWRAPFVLYLTALPMLGLVLFSSSAAPAREVSPRASDAVAVPSGSLLKQWPYYLMLVPMSAASYMTAVHLSFVLAGDGVTSPGTQAVIMTASMIFNIVGSVYYARIRARFGRRWVFVMILGIFGAGDLLIGFSPNAVGSAAGCWVAGLAGGLMTPFFINVILDRTDSAVHGRAIGLMYTMTYIGNFLNPFIITPLRAAIGNHSAFAVVGVGLALAAGLQAVTRRSPVGTG